MSKYIVVLVLILSGIARTEAQDATVQKPGAYTAASGNYVRTWTAVKPTTDPNTLSTATLVKDAQLSTQYFDGLGRPLQTVVKQGSLITNPSSLVSAANAKDMVSPVVYDEYGREVRKYLPYAAPDAAGNFKLDPFSEQAAFFSGSSSPILNQGYNYYYGKTEYEASPLNRVLRTYAPGDSWVKSGSINNTTDRGVKASYLTNTTTDAVRIWTITNHATVGEFGSYSSLGPYAAGTLYKTITENEDLNQVIEFKDKDGRVILKKVQVLSGTKDNGTTGSAHTNWLCTYYIYDDLGQLRAVLQPRGAELLWPAAVNWNINSVAGLLDEQFFRYEYDQRGRMIAKKVPGAAPVWMVYDARDRLVMTQDGRQRGLGQWFYTQYDALNRPVSTGLFTETTVPSTLTSFQNHRNAAYNSTTYPNPASYANREVLSRTFYDDYVWAANGASPKNPAGTTMDGGYSSYLWAADGNFPYAETPVQSSAIKGKLTGTKIKILGTANDYLYTAYYYDDKGRVIQVKTKSLIDPNPYPNTAVSTNYPAATVTTNQYSFSGQLLVSVSVQQLGTSGTAATVATRNTYDELGRVVQVDKKVTNTTTIPTAWKKLYTIEYDALGQVELKNLGVQSNGSPRTRLNYDYNIRGWLLGLNRSYLSTTNFNNSFFAMDLCYDKGGLTGTIPRYSGNIGLSHWRSQGDFIPRRYSYSYDPANRLLKADFYQKEGTTWTFSNVNFSMLMGDGSNPSTAYDMNGNIKSMQQSGLKLNGSAVIDKMTYGYKKNSSAVEVSNRLEAVTEDQAAVGAQNSKLGDFLDKNTTGADYGYDENGNLNQDKNKGISAITYNHLNLPQVITVTGKGTITYTYDAGGNKLKKVTTEPTATVTVNGTSYTTSITTTTSYLGGAVYESKNYSNATVNTALGYSNQLQFLAHEEGRIRLRSLDNTFQWDYFIKDHLGNVRSLVTEEFRRDKYPVATLEDSKVATEDDYYKIDASKIVLSNTVANLPAYTNDNGIGNNPSDPSFEGASSQKLYRLKGNENKTGLGITLKVMARDTLNIHGRSYWSEANTGGSVANVAPAVIDLLSGLVGAPSAAAAGAHASATELNGIAAVNTPVGAYINDANRNNPTYPNRPKAFINYLFFDEQFRPLQGTEVGGFSAVSNTAGMKPHFSDLQNIVVPKNGYVYIYVSNESPVPVFFDNLQVVHGRGPLLEETHYYPFGLAMAGISSKAAGASESKKRFQGQVLAHQEFSDGSGLEMYEFKWRMADPQTGRFWQMDPLADKYVYNSTYAFSENKVTGHVELEGLEAVIVNKPYLVENGKIVPGYSTLTNVDNPFKLGNGTLTRYSFDGGYVDGKYYKPYQMEVYVAPSESAGGFFQQIGSWVKGFFSGMPQVFVFGNQQGGFQLDMGSPVDYSKPLYSANLGSGGEANELFEAIMLFTKIPTSYGGSNDPRQELIDKFPGLLDKLGKKFLDDKKRSPTSSVCLTCDQNPHGLPYVRTNERGDAVDTVFPYPSKAAERNKKPGDSVITPTIDPTKRPPCHGCAGPAQ